MHLSKDLLLSTSYSCGKVVRYLQTMAFHWIRVRLTDCFYIAEKKQSKKLKKSILAITEWLQLFYERNVYRNAVEIWKILSQDSQIVIVMLDHMLEVYQKSLPYEEKAEEGREPIRKATQIPLAVNN